MVRSEDDEEELRDFDRARDGFFDMVLDGGMNPVFNDTPEIVKEWLLTHDVDDEHTVCIGRRIEVVSVEDYLRR